MGGRGGRGQRESAVEADKVAAKDKEGASSAWERAQRVCRGRTAGQRPGSLTLAVVSSNWGHQPRLCVFLQSCSAVQVQARSRQKTGCKQGWNLGKQAGHSEREARKSGVWARTCLQ